MQELLVAAGGGGDALAASLLAQNQPGERLVIATWAWDRLVIDPLPGPRSAEDFDKLDSPAPHVHIVTADTSARPPAGSTLPMLAANLAADLVLIDPYQGCQGITEQIKAAAEWCNAEQITVVEVGGDALARPGDPGLKSPLADITSVVATSQTGIPARLVVLGPGCDGELTPELIQQRLTEVGAEELAPITPELAKTIVAMLRWHPSEATALLVAASFGYRGRVEIRDKGLPVELTDATRTAWQVPLDQALPPAHITRAISATQSLEELEAIFEQLYSVGEIEYERQKAASLADTAGPQRHLSCEDFLHQAHNRQTQWVTRRRLREATGYLPDQYKPFLLISTGSE